MNTETKKCPQCGKTAYHNRGISRKTGEPYANWKCPCGYLEWLDVEKPKEEEPNWGQIRQEKAERIDWLNAKKIAADILIAAYQKGDIVSYEVILQKLDEITAQIYGTKPE